MSVGCEVRLVDRAGPRRDRDRGASIQLGREASSAWVLRELVARPARLSRFVSLLGLCQRLRLDRLALPLLPRSLRELYPLLPAIPPSSERRRLPQLTPAVGERRGQVVLFVGCVMPELFGAINAATQRVLAQNGFDVIVPSSQGCCGALHAHSGDLDWARNLARNNLEGPSGLAPMRSSSTPRAAGAALRELGEWLPGEGNALAARVRDVSEFLDEAGLRAPSGRVEARVCYDDPCHLVHGQGVGGSTAQVARADSGTRAPSPPTTRLAVAVRLESTT